MFPLYSKEGKANVAGTENKGEGVQGEAGEPASGSSVSFLKWQHKGIERFLGTI